MAGLLNDQESDWEPSYGLLGLAAGLMQPTRGGSFGEALGNGAQGWASGAAMGRKLKQQDEATRLDAIKAQIDRARLQHQATGQWSLTPYVDGNGDVYRFHTDGRVEKLALSGKYQPNMQVNTGGTTQIINPNAPDVPKAVIPHTQTPDQVADNTPHYEPTDVQGRPGQRNTLTGEIKLYPEAPQMPATARAALDSRISMLDQIAIAEEALNSHPDAVGAKNLAPSASYWRQWTDPTGVAARAAIGRIGGQQIHELSGAAVSASEAPRFVPFVPSINDSKETTLEKLKQMKSLLESEKRQIESPYTPVNVEAGNTHFNFRSRDEAERLYDSMENGAEREALGKVLGKTSAPTSMHRVIGPDGKPHIAILRDGQWEIQ